MPNRHAKTKKIRPTVYTGDRASLIHKVKFLRYAWNIGLIDINSYREGREEAQRQAQILISTGKSTHKDRSSTPILVHSGPNDISKLGDIS